MCSPPQCLHGGTCEELSDTLDCVCPEEWLGDRCEVDNPCFVESGSGKEPACPDPLRCVVVDDGESFECECPDGQGDCPELGQGGAGFMGLDWTVIGVMASLFGILATCVGFCIRMKKYRNLRKEASYLKHSATYHALRTSTALKKAKRKNDAKELIRQADDYL